MISEINSVHKTVCTKQCIQNNVHSKSRGSGHVFWTCQNLSNVKTRWRISGCAQNTENKTLCTKQFAQNSLHKTVCFLKVKDLDGCFEHVKTCQKKVEDLWVCTKQCEQNSVHKALYTKHFEQSSVHPKSKGFGRVFWIYLNLSKRGGGSLSVHKTVCTS